MQTMINKPQPTAWALPNITGLGGAVAGALAGIVTVIVSPVLALLTGHEMWDPFLMIAARLLGPDVLAQAGFAFVPVLIGVLVCLAGATLFGAIFGALYRRVLHLPTAFGLPVYVGLVYGILTCALVAALILPSNIPAWAATAALTPVLMQQLVFAVCLGMFYMLLRPAPYQDTIGID